MNKLFRSIDILDDKSLTVLMYNTRSNLWILRHFKDLTISNKNICYQVNNGHRQRKNTKHPYRWMRKKFCNTAEFLDYLDTKAEDYMTFALGTHNKSDENPSPNLFSFQNTAFVIGNGGFDSNGNYLGEDNRSNAFEVLFDGTTTIAGDLNVNSDARLKANIVSLGSTLSKLLQIDGKSYTMKKDDSEKQKIGLLAQDIEKVFPELVSESHGIKSVNYQGLVPVLINALKEQQSEIEILKQQQSEIDELKTMLKTLIEKT